ncbi:hypothetical protein [Streptomyces sp. NBC_00209]|uniref:hypothetical protein n=1 Tax=Streptomyces sp. NBC_00209 TaxID=2975682 RepID=UPI003255B5A6
MSMKKFGTAGRRISVLFAAIVSMLLFVPAQPSMADTTTNVSDNCDTYNSGCSYGDLDIHYNTIAYDGYYSAIASFYGNVYSYAGKDVSPNGAVVIHYKYVFGKNVNGVKASGTGAAVKNQGGSVENCAPADSYRVYYNSGYAGSSQYFQSTYGGLYCQGAKYVDLNSTLHNNNASQHFA